MQDLALIHNGRRLETRVLACEGILERLRGLIGRRPLRHDRVLLLRPCSGVHTLGMRYEIDVVFCRADGSVLRCVRGLPPGRATWHPGADAAWEMRSGQCTRLRIRVGDRLTAEP